MLTKPQQQERTGSPEDGHRHVLLSSRRDGQGPRNELEDPDRLEHTQNQGQGARAAVLLLAGVFASFLELHLPRRVGVGKDLQDNAGRNVRAKAERQNGQPLECTAPDLVHQAEERVIVHQLFQHGRLHARNGHDHVDAECVNRKDDEDEGDSSS